MSGKLETRLAEVVRAVHNALGAGRREMNYEVALAHELTRRGCSVERQAAAADLPLKADLLVDGTLAVFIYAVEPVTPDHEQRIRTYLGAAALKTACLLDFSQSDASDCLSWIRK